MAKATRIVADDCMPFYKEGKNAITEIDNKILKEFVDSIIPIQISNDNTQNDDDSKLAYSPYENPPFIFHNENGKESKWVWQAGRYVGSTKIGNNTIEIKPRFGIIWLKYLLDDITHFKLVPNEAKSDSGNLNELMRKILWHLWVRKFAEADQYGLPRSVIKRTHQGLQIRGHLNSRKSLFPLFTKRQIVSEYREREIDDSICSIVYKAYCILVNRNVNDTKVPSQIQDSLNNLYSHYQGQSIVVSTQDYHDVSYKSIYISWKPLVDFSWQIINQDSLYKFNNEKGASFSLFLDMAEIWESFLRKKLGEGFDDDGWRVLSVNECKFDIYNDNFYGRKIIPDIILKRQNGNGEFEYMVFDAKYKTMNIKGKNFDVDRTDLFQIHTYIQFVEHHLGHVIAGGLLYPLTKKVQGENGDNVEINFDHTSFHSENLYGYEGRNNAPKTAFIIDGIYCPENKDYNDFDDEKYEKYKNEMDMNIKAMIDRIKNQLSNIQE